MFHFLSRLFGFTPPPNKCSVRREKRVRPSLEVLEHRITPTSYDVAILTDNNPNTGGQMLGPNVGDLRYCINQMNTTVQGDNTIVFLQGVKPLQGTISLQAALPDIQKNVTIPGQDNTVPTITIQGNGGPGNAYRIFTIDGGVTATISYLKITGGYYEGSTGGGAIYNSGNLTLSNDVVSGNYSSEDGGAILNSVSASLALSSDVIENNSAAVNGGGIENFGTLSNNSQNNPGTTQIISNDAQGGNGGGIYNLGTVSFENPTGIVKILQNTALFDGGGVYNGVGYNFAMGGTNSLIGSNTAGGYGGGLCNNGTATLDHNLWVSSNTANKGGGLYLGKLSTANLSLITVQGNILAGAGSAGKGIYEASGAQLPIYDIVTDADDPGGQPVQGQ